MINEVRVLMIVIRSWVVVWRGFSFTDCKILQIKTKIQSSLRRQTRILWRLQDYQHTVQKTQQHSTWNQIWLTSVDILRHLENEMCDNIWKWHGGKTHQPTHRMEEDTDYPNFTERRERTRKKYHVKISYHKHNTGEREKMLKDRAWHLLENE